MKKTTLTFVAVISAILLLAQTPQAFKYQAVVRDNAGNVLVNQNVNFRFSILQGSAGGTSVYAETHNATTNGFGLVNLEIGNGAVVSGVFSTIDWGGNSFFLQIEMDETGGGTSYQLMGTSQLLSVPYSLYSESSGDAGATEINELNDGKTGGNSVFLGSDAGANDNGTDNRNVAVGIGALNANTSGIKNTASGFQALIFNMEGERNTANGYRTLFSNTTGNNNTAIGYQADFYNQEGSNNTIIGYKAGFALVSHNKSGNVFLGYHAGYYDITDNKLYIENSASSSPLIYGEFDNDILAFNANVGIGTQSPHPSAKLEVESTTKGMLMPRMTQTEIEAITSPANGLIVYNTDDCKFYVYRDCSSEWNEIAIGAADKAL